MRPILASLVVLASGLAAGASAQAVFEPPRITPLPFPFVFITDPVIGDLDEDGDLDAIITEGSGPGGTLHTYVNDGSGTLVDGPVQTGLGGCTTAALADMNGDALPDYLVALGSQVIVFFGDGDGQFDGNMSFSTSTGCNHLAVGDLNGDSIPDVALTSPIVPFFAPFARLQVWLRNGTSFTLAQSQNLAFTPTDLDLADVDGDGLLDAVVTRQGVASWHAGQALGTLGPATPIAGTVAANQVAVGDLDADGDLDLVLGSDQPQVQPVHNDGAGGFSPGVILPTSPGGAWPAIADIDADGLADLVLDDSGTGGDGQLVIWRGLGGGAYEEDVHVTGGGLAGNNPVLIGDMDGDGRPDVVTRPGGTAVYLNRTYEPGSPFLDLGFALPGSHGYPVQIASGTLQVGTPFSFRLMNGLPGAAATLVIGASAAYLPHKGGVMVPFPNLLLTGFLIDAQGSVTLGGNWPAGLPHGVTLYTQWWFKDAAGPTPKAATSGLSLTTP